MSLVLGVPTVRREVQSYLMTTLANLITSMTPQEMKECLIVVFVAEVRPSYEAHPDSLSRNSSTGSSLVQ